MKPYNALWHHQGTSQTVPAKCRTFLFQATNHAPFSQRKYSHTVRLLFILIENSKFFKPICLPFGAWFSLWHWLAAATSITVLPKKLLSINLSIAFKFNLEQTSQACAKCSQVLAEVSIWWSLFQSSASSWSSLPSKEGRLAPPSLPKGFTTF